MLKAEGRQPSLVRHRLALHRSRRYRLVRSIIPMRGSDGRFDLRQIADVARIADFAHDRR